MGDEDGDGAGTGRVRPGHSGFGSSAHSGSAYVDGASSTSSSASGSGPRSPQPRGAGSDGQPGTPGSVSGASAAAPPRQAAVPFNPPDSVQQWLEQEDWNSLSRQFAEAEERALVWTEVDSEDSRSQPSLTSSVSPSTLPRRRRRRQWDQDFNLVGSDSRKPPPLRRYFDDVPAESSPPTQSVRRGSRLAAALGSGSASAGSSPAMHHAGWVDSWNQTASVNNDILHPHLRHYFDRRGIEASYRQRPHIDHESCRRLRPRTPQRPPIRDMLMKYSLSDSSLMSSGSSAAPGRGVDKLDVKHRSQGSIHWGKRCLVYGADASVQRSPKGERIPWINDHHRGEAEDNELMNPMLRHYFDADGIESSFRNRGRHYGRPPRPVFGCSNFKEYLSPPAASSPGGGAGGAARR